jgi:hypothetical protein
MMMTEGGARRLVTLEQFERLPESDERTADDPLEGGDVLPGFRLEVARLFRF